MYKRIYSIAIFFLNFYFGLQMIDASFGLIGKRQLGKLSVLLLLSVLFLVYNKLKKSVSKIDILIISYTAFFSLLGLFYDYPRELWKYGVITQFYYMLFFIVGEYYHENINVFRNGYYAVILACLIGLPLYFLSPSWYIEYKSTGITINNTSEGSINTFLRFSSLWTVSYWISYGCGIFYTYVLHRAYLRRNLRYIDILILLFFIVILLLTQQRAPFALIVMSSVFYLVAPLPKKCASDSNYKRRLILTFLSIFGVSVFMLLYAGLDQMQFIFEKFEEMTSGDFLSERTNIYAMFYDITLFGHGIGISSHAALDFNMESCADQMYLRLLYETGIAGCIWLLCIFMPILSRGVKFFRYYQFELLVIAFFLVSMTGADSLALMTQHSPIFWFCCGRICNKNLLQKRKISYEENFR